MNRLASTLKILVVVFATLYAQTTFAIGAITAHVLQVRVDETGRGMVIFDTNIGGTPPACVTSSYVNALAFTMADAGGKAVLAVALTAKATGATITAFGTGACNIYSPILEDWQYGAIN